MDFCLLELLYAALKTLLSQIIFILIANFLNISVLDRCDVATYYKALIIIVLIGLNLTFLLSFLNMDTVEKHNSVNSVFILNNYFI